MKLYKNKIKTIYKYNLDMEKDKVIPIILYGGSGSRLWPLSRASFPKQYLSLILKQIFLLQQTIMRVSDLENI